ncbi:zinc transporter [Roseivivax halotolerans]|uniref:Zinc transporter n=1 Tax=Roseivivax halotolerans TaxID=93684 RepID=A0A1I5XDT8_9RHOB|nr:zinc transporter [Roseivivax halotolerans]
MRLPPSTIQPVCAFDIAKDGSTKPADPLTPQPEGALRWIHLDLGDPALEDWLFANLPERAAEALVQPETRPRALAHDGGVIAVLRGLNLNEGEDRDDMVALRIWASKTLFVTVRRRRVFAAQDLEARGKAGHLPASADMLLVALAENFTSRIEENGVALENRVDTLEDILFLDDRDPSSKELPEMRRTVIRLSRFLGPQAQALARLARPDMSLIGPEAREDLEEIANRAERAVEEVQSTRDRLEALNDHLDQARNLRLAKNSYALSIVAAVFLPMGFLTGLFGVNVAGMPGVETPSAFALLTLGSIALGGGVFLVLRAFRLF